MFAEETVMIFIPFIPGAIFTDIPIILALPVLLFIIFYYLAPYTARFYVKLHRGFCRLTGSRSQYGVMKLGKGFSGWQLFSRTMILSLFTFSIANFLVGLGLGTVFIDYSSGMALMDSVIYIFVASLCLGAITLIIF